ncbi:hypothetical protein PAE9249_04172 [Paenibacillus sp. CECT 9249]|uniref:helix-turn-helix domain-containing protein n=1 Tax=Paenibacillus sp. CECT 9249 TaxID=2845385 RepID=UPI001E3F9578|nr:helix-turn-helix domain-containing protein [Paenibacillus sp. CECT 9249]CAH0121640.1 hypothetical protein PAE9249_04172 [Paenibacillus sp. CECT 9249]
MKKADLLLHPVRMRIVQQLLTGKPRTILELVELLGDVPQATLYRHMKLLHEANLIEVVETHKVQGREERVYSVAKDNLMISENELNTASQEEHVRYFTAYHANLLQLATSYIMQTSPERYQEDGFGYSYAPLHLTDEEFEEFVQSINQLVQKAAQHEPSPDRKTRILASILIPQKTRGQEEGESE